MAGSWRLLLLLLSPAATLALIPGPTLAPRLPRTPFASRHASSLLAASEDSSPPLMQRLQTATKSVVGFLDRRYFLVGVAAAVSLAGVYPAFGRRGGPLRPELTVAWGATCGIFLLSGLNLPTSELARAAASVRLHGLIQAFNLLYIPLATLLSCNALVTAGLLTAPLRDGMLVMSALPTTINMCVALSRSSGGDEALAICAHAAPRTHTSHSTSLPAAAHRRVPRRVRAVNAVLGNLLGVILTPYLLLRLVGSAGALSAVDTLQKLATRVLLPLLVGQSLRPPMQKLIAGRKKLLSRSSESLLLLIIYSTFCDTFLRGFGIPARSLAGLAGLVSISHLAHLATAWQLGGALRLTAKQRITFTLTGTQKTLALGLPLLRVVFAGRPDLGVLCTPILLQHPLQLIIGSLLSPKLKQCAEEEQGQGKKD